MNKIIKWAKKNWSGITTAVSLLGLGTSLYFTAKTAIKVDKILEEKPITKEEKQEKRIEILKECVPPVLSVITTVSSILFTYKTSKKKELALLSTCLMGQSILIKYRDKIEEMYGEEIEKNVYNSIFEKNVPAEVETKNEDGQILFCESISGTFFYDTVEHVLMAENESNRTFIIREGLSFNDWLSYLGIDEYDEGDIIGWCTCAEPYYGYKWIDFNHIKKTDVNGKEYYLITYPFPPHIDYLDCDGDYPIE